MLSRPALAVLLSVVWCVHAFSQSFSPFSPVKEYVRSNGQVIAIENSQLKDGTFETGTLGPWTIAGGNAAVGPTAYSGAYGVTMGGTSAQSWVYQDVGSIVPGRVYQVSVWVKASTATNNGVELWVHDTQGNGSLINMVTPNTSWQQISTIFVGTVTGQLRIALVQLAGTTETTYWDDVTVAQLPANGDFETGMPAPWQQLDGNWAISNVAHSGHFSLMLGGTTSQTLAYQNTAGLVPTQMYVVSVWVQASAPSTSVSLWVHDTQGNGSVMNTVSATTGWQQISVAFTATSIGALRIHLIQNPGSSASANSYWDDVTVTTLPVNKGFETGVLSPWVIQGGNAAVTNNRRSGAYGLTLGNTTAQSWVSQDIAGLVPGQSYLVSAWVQSTSSTNCELYVHDTLGNNANAVSATAGNTWQQFSVTFTATSTGKLRIHLIQTANQTTSSNWDDVMVVPSSGGSSNAIRAQQTRAARAVSLPTPDTEVAAGSSFNVAKSLAEVPPFPAGTAQAQGTSSDPVVPANNAAAPR